LRSCQNSREKDGKQQGDKYRNFSRQAFPFRSVIWLPSAIHVFLFDNAIGPKQNIRRDRQANLLCGVQVNNKFKLSRSFYGQLTRVGTFQDFVHISRGMTKSLNLVY
jgi:hypothetical protein